MCYSGATLAEKDKVIAMYYGVDIGDIVATSSDPLLLNWEKVATPAIPRVKSGETLCLTLPFGKKTAYTMP